jgi:hypothetical protein
MTIVTVFLAFKYSMGGLFLNFNKILNSVDDVSSRKEENFVF